MLLPYNDVLVLRMLNADWLPGWRQACPANQLSPFLQFVSPLQSGRGRKQTMSARWVIKEECRKNQNVQKKYSLSDNTSIESYGLRKVETPVPVRSLKSSNIVPASTWLGNPLPSASRCCTRAAAWLNGPGGIGQYSNKQIPISIELIFTFELM